MLLLIICWFSKNCLLPILDFTNNVGILFVWHVCCTHIWDFLFFIELHLSCLIFEERNFLFVLVCVIDLICIQTIKNNIFILPIFACFALNNFILLVPSKTVLCFIVASWLVITWVNGQVTKPTWFLLIESRTQKIRKNKKSKMEQKWKNVPPKTKKKKISNDKIRSFQDNYHVSLIIGDYQTKKTHSQQTSKMFFFCTHTPFIFWN